MEKATLEPSLSAYEALSKQMTCDILCALISGRGLDNYTTSYEYMRQNDLPKAQRLAESILKEK